MYISYITCISLLFSRSILTSTEIDGKNSSETEQNMSEKQGTSKSVVDEKINPFFFCIGCLLEI
jgi:hypothetical protein